MDFYRGDNRHPSDLILNSSGFTARPPARTMSGPEARAYLEAQIGAPQDVGMRWRLQTPGGLIATSMTQAGAYGQTDFFYKISIPDSELTLTLLDRKWNRTQDLPASAAPSRSAYFLLFNNRDYQAADLIALCHGQVNSKEVTFLTAIPSRYIVGFRQGAQTTREEVPFIPFRRLNGLARTPPVPA